MPYLLPTFQLVALIFACLSIYTGAQALLAPIAFSRFFGIPIIYVRHVTTDAKANDKAKSYVELMGVRQLATGVVLLVFAWQEKWVEIATILAVLGVLVAGVDGLILASAKKEAKARFHAIPGLCIALLAIAVVFTVSLEWHVTKVLTRFVCRKWCLLVALNCRYDFVNLHENVTTDTTRASFV